MVAADVITCIDNNLCKVLTTNSYYISIGVFVVAGILLTLLFFLAFWTPGFIFLRAKMSKNPLLYIVNRGQSGRFAVGRAKTEGILDVRKLGPIIITENSHTRETKSGIPLFVAFGEFAATNPLKWIYSVNKIKEEASKQGKEIKNISDFGKVIGREYNEVTGIWDSKE